MQKHSGIRLLIGICASIAAGQNLKDLQQAIKKGTAKPDEFFADGGGSRRARFVQPVTIRLEMRVSGSIFMQCG